jgi:hypothetical protein
LLPQKEKKYRGRKFSFIFLVLNRERKLHYFFYKKTKPE